MRKMKNYLKTGIVLIGISLLFWNCQEEEINQTDVKSFQFKITKVNNTTIQQNKFLTEKLNKIQQKTENSKNGFQSKNVYSNQYDFTINTDFATYIENEDGTYHSYTFQISREVDNGLLENLLLSLQPDGSYKTILIAYNLSLQDKQNLVNGIPIDYNNKVTYTTIKDDSLVSEIFSKSTLNCLWISTSYCKEGNHPGGYDNGVKCPAYALYTTVECIGGSGGGSGDQIGYTDTSENTNESGTNTSSGSGGTTTSNPDVTSPTGVILSLEEQIFQNFIKYNLNFEQKSWINDIENLDYQNQIINFLNNNLNESDLDFTIEAKNFALIAIEALRNDGEVDYVEKLIYDPGLEQEIKSRMTTKEIGIFDNLTSFQQYQYLKSAIQAYNYAEIHYPKPVRNRKGDAIKHSFWNALSTVRLGASLTKQLTDAHEEITFDTNYPNHYKEKQMDLFNNEKGRQIAYGSGRLYQLIETALANGELRYLSNLTLYNNTYYRASDSSQLIPTNQ